jgi:hypothetical protein
MTDSDEQRNTKDFWIIFSSSVFFGALVGGIVYGNWQVVVESGQAISGVVPYDNDNAFYRYHLKAWTFAHQVTALFLLTGLSAKAISLLVSAILGSMIFGVFSGIVWVLSKHRLFSLVAPFTILSLYGIKSHYTYGVVYPIFMFGTHHSNGVLGRNLAILTLLALASTRARSAFFLLGLLPAFHVTWGAWTWGVVFWWLVWEKRLNLETLKKCGPWMLGGFTITLVSFLYQRIAAGDFPVVDAETQSRHLTAFFEHWDYHRATINLKVHGMYMGVTSLIVAGSWLYSFRDSLSNPAVSFLRILILSSIFSLIACVFTAFPQFLPNIVNMLMIGRFINLSIAALPVLILGVLVSHVNRSHFVQILLSAHFLYIVFDQFFMAFLSSDRFGWYLPHWMEICGLGLVTAAYALHSKSKSVNLNSVPLDKRALAIIVGSVSIVFVSAILDHGKPLRNKKSFIVQDISPVLQSAAESEGYLISPGGIELIQLITGRPVLLNTGGLDQITVAPGSAPEMARVLEGVYGIDFFDPPDEIKERRPSALLENSGRDFWESRSPNDWAGISNDFNATQLLAPVEWKIQLTPSITDEDWALYDLP